MFSIHHVTHLLHSSRDPPPLISRAPIEQVFSIITVAAGLGLYALVIGNMASVLSKFDRQRQGVRRQLKAVRDLLSRREEPHRRSARQL